jgi:hypothetical protein
VEVKAKVLQFQFKYKNLKNKIVPLKLNYLLNVLNIRSLVQRKRIEHNTHKNKNKIKL